MSYKKMKSISKILKIVCLFIAFLILMITLAFGVLIFYNAPVNNRERPVAKDAIDGVNRMEDGSCFFDVRKGESSQSVGARLERAGLIKSGNFWNLLCRARKEYVKSGVYRINARASATEIHSLLVSGNQVLNRVTIPEGATLGKIAAILEDAEVCEASDFLAAARDIEIINQYKIPNASMEGYLFPDTYLFQAKYPAEKVIGSMAENFYKRIESVNPSAPELSASELNDYVILASIIEREYRISDEAPLMAGVFYNRLKINMALQSCATVEYIITEIQGKAHPSVIYNQDLEIRDPYNTYIRAGLPPGPISAPGIVALNAAMFPAKTEYLYFRLDDPASGRHYFSRTLDEHIKAGQLFTKRQ